MSPYLELYANLFVFIKEILKQNLSFVGWVITAKPITYLSAYKKN